MEDLTISKPSRLAAEVGMKKQVTEHVARRLAIGKGEGKTADLKDQMGRANERRQEKSFVSCRSVHCSGK